MGRQAAITIPTGGPAARPSRYVRWARREQPEPARIRATLLVAPVFLGLLPFVVLVVGPWVDRRLRLPALGAHRPAIVGGAAVSAAGYALALWTVETQVSRGRGTPLPVLPTQELLTTGPYRHTRNPMTLGAILAYLGMAVAAGTTAGGAIVLSLSAALLGYLRGLEEGELAERFGPDYLAYRAATPFLVPAIRVRGRPAGQPPGRSSGSTP